MGYSSICKRKFYRIYWNKGEDYGKLRALMGDNEEKGDINVCADKQVSF
jgi:hypothetical protein